MTIIIQFYKSEAGPNSQYFTHVSGKVALWSKEIREFWQKSCDSVKTWESLTLLF